MRELTQPAVAARPGPPSVDAQRRAARWDLLVELAVTGAGVAGIVLLLLMIVFVVREALPLVLDPVQREQASLAKLLLPQPWRDGHAPALLWNPTSKVPKVSVWPLVIGTLKVTGVALAVAAPAGVAAALFTSEFAPSRLRTWVKPTIELLAGIPSVVLGSFALMTLASALQSAFGFDFRLNALVAGLAMSLAIVPVIYTLSDDALRAVPHTYREAALALGATRWETAFRVVLPAAAPGVLGALVLGVGRAVGETMIVLMASGNAALVSANLAEPTRTVSATIAAEMGEVVMGSTHASLLFLLGAILFVFNLVLNVTAGAWVRARLARREGAPS
ncbi:MAG: phosphate ABC transporter permease subunit PstC [Myxococcaceae bacterium]|jgi:phosphate transport system permease protein|nr:phosphate ABC transporter permease subunit PstC [Myxococcaceae bacterium]